MAIKYTIAQKILKPLKVFYYGPTFSGKTLGAINTALGIVMSKRTCDVTEAYKHILLVDTEYGRGALYSNLGPYNYIAIEAPYNVSKLNEIITDINYDDEIDVVIIDSLTHFWTKKGGILDQKAAVDKLGGNSYTNWNNFTMIFNESLDLLLSSPKCVIITARAKTDTVISEDARGKQVPKVYGLKPELRDGIEFDFDIVGNIDKESHDVLIEKGIPGMDTVYGPITPEFGTMLHVLSMQSAVTPVQSKDDLIESIRSLAKAGDLITFVQLKLSGTKLQDKTYEELKELETELIAEYKKNQAKR